MSITRKAEAKRLLACRDRAGLAEWVAGTRDPLGFLFSLTYVTDELLGWRAIEACGQAAALLARAKIDKLRDFLRRLQWLMNDESGGVAWRAPEVIGEIGYNVPELVEPYGRLLLPYLQQEPFRRGTFCALSRLAPAHHDLVAASRRILHTALKDADPLICAYALIALRSELTDSLIGELAGNSTEVTLYDFSTGELVQQTIGDLVRRPGSGVSNST